MARIALVPPVEASLVSKKPFFVMREAMRDLVVIRAKSHSTRRQIETFRATNPDPVP